MTLAAAVLCAHCGNPCSGENPIAGAAFSGADGTIVEPFFCCQGCRAVYELLKLRGLGQYYDLKRLTGVIRKAAPVSEVADRFSYLENAEFLEVYSSPGENGEQTRMQFYLEGVHCAACVWLVEKLPEFVDGVASARLDFSRSVATVEARPGTPFSAVAREFLALGYRPHPVRDGEAETLRAKENRELLIRTGVAAAAAGNIMLLAISLYAGAVDEWGARFRWTSFLLYLPVILYSAVPFYRNAWASIRAKTLSIDVSVAVALALGSGASIANLLAPRMPDGTFPHIYFDSLAAFVFLLLGSRYLLKRAQQSALDSSHLLRFLAPSIARRQAATGEFEEVPVEALRRGDVLEVRAGESLPADGTVIEGRSLIDRSLLTGESVWSEIGPGAEVFAGTVNCEAPVSIRVSQAGAATRLGKILEAAAEGATRKARIVDAADRLAKVFVLGTFLLAGGVLLWNAWDGGDFQNAFNRALSVVIVACPCALALATPLAMTVGIGRAARSGVLIKGADVVEKLARARTLFLDKTGTVTEGRFQVIRTEGLDESAQAALLALEERSNHPLGRAVVRHLRATNPKLKAAPISEFRETIGRGVEARIEGTLYEVRQDRDTRSPESGLSGEPGSRIGLFKEGALVGAITLGDVIRADSKAAIQELQSLGVRVKLLSGDSRAVVATTARDLGIEPGSAIAECTPEEKARIVSSEPFSVMVGDGANDAVALASAYAGVAVRGGMEVSLRSADAYLNAPGVMPLRDMILGARGILKVVWRNLIFSLAYNVLGVYAALAGWVNPLFAAILMPISAFTVLGSSVLAGRIPRIASGSAASGSDERGTPG